jgi:membrane protease YdiL (CAAX protease family)
MTSTVGQFDPWTPPVGPARAGWYDDPQRTHAGRYWDGRGWTRHVTDAGVAGEDRLPVGDDGRPVVWAPPLVPGTSPAPGPLPTLPARAAALGVAGLIAGAVLGIGFGLLLARVLDAPRLLVLLVSQGFLWTGMVGPCVLVSRRYGTGSLRADFGVGFRAVDLGWGLLLAIAGRIGAAVVAVCLAAVSRRLIGSNLTGIDELRNDVPTLVTYCLFALVGAPLIEELFFRGLLLRSFASRMPVGIAVLAQGLLFCLAHTIPALGLANASVLAGTAVFGIMAGATAVQLRRLGATMVAHALFNLVAVLGLLFLA